jgi:predicted Zn-dependent peptidase
LTRKEILPGVYLTAEQTDKFKTALLSVNLLRPLCEEEASLGALLPSVLLRGTERYSDMEQISAYLDSLYGAGLCGAVRKKGEVQTVGFFADFIEDALAPAGEPVLREMVDFVGEVLLHPYRENGVFAADYVASERLNLINTIESRVNDKRAYVTSRLIQTMCAGEAYGVDRLGTVETAEKITPESLFAYYEKILATSQYELFYCGRAPFDEVTSLLRKALSELPDRTPVPVGTAVAPLPTQVRRAGETMDVTQGKLVLGLRTQITVDDPRYPALVLLNVIYGAGVSSKLFVNVREALSLCYYAGSAIEKYKGVMVVSSGVETENLERAEAEILRQLDDCREGRITDEELDAARRYLRSSLRAALDSPGRLEDHALSQAIAGSEETIGALSARIEAVTAEQVAEAARSLALDTVFTLKGETA